MYLFTIQFSQILFILLKALRNAFGRSSAIEVTKSAEIAKQSKVVEAVKPATATASSEISNIPNQPKIETVLAKDSKESSITDEIPVVTTHSTKLEQKIATPNLVETPEPVSEKVVLSKNAQQSAIIKEIERPQVEADLPNTEEKKFFKVSIVPECKCIYH